MLLILISPPENIPGEHDTLISLFEAGLEVFHLRKPGFSGNKMETYLQNIPVKFHQRMVLHSHYPLALQYDLKGIHLTEMTRKDTTTGDLLKAFENKSVSASFHRLEDIEQNHIRYNYIFLSPIFDSISKSGYKSNFNMDKVSGFLKAPSTPMHIPVIALGGISEDHMSSVKNAGFAGAALLGAVWQSALPVKTFLTLMKQSQEPRAKNQDW